MHLPHQIVVTLKFRSISLLSLCVSISWLGVGALTTLRRHVGTSAEECWHFLADTAPSCRRKNRSQRRIIFATIVPDVASGSHHGATRCKNRDGSFLWAAGMRAPTSVPHQGNRVHKNNENFVEFWRARAIPVMPTNAKKISP